MTAVAYLLVQARDWHHPKTVVVVVELTALPD